MLAAWLAFWDKTAGVQLVSRVELRLGFADSTPAEIFLFWGLPTVGIAAVQLVCYSLDRAFLKQRWTTLDLLRLALWRTVSPTFPLLFLATGFSAFYDRRLIGILWLVMAAIVALAAMLRLRSAEGMKLQEVKGGELYKRAFVLAKVTKTPLERVYVVPAGRGHLTNAYAGAHTIAVTDNYGKFLTSTQLDFVIGHELGHSRGKHGQKKLVVTAAVVAIMAVACFSMSTFLSRYRPFLDVAIVFGPVLTFYFLSRRFEYAADAAGVELTGSPMTAIQALVNLYRTTEAPMDCDKLTELFLTHPALTRRARAIGERSGISPDRVSGAIEDNELIKNSPD